VKISDIVNNVIERLNPKIAVNKDEFVSMRCGAHTL
jgi:hypothetical protein